MTTIEVIRCDKCFATIQVSESKQRTGEDTWMKIEASRADSECHPSNKMTRDLCPSCFGAVMRLIKGTN